MKIVTIPHPSLRQKSEPIEVASKQLWNFVNEIESTLKRTRNPKGVGLAAPQVNSNQRIFALAVDDPLTMINPMFTKVSDQLTLGPDPKEPFLEGCLSIPKIWGPVFRHLWVEVEYEIVLKGSHGLRLEKRTGKFSDFYARVIQHEMDHLNGVLFIDRSYHSNLPVFQSETRGSHTEQLERSILEALIKPIQND